MRNIKKRIFTFEMAKHNILGQKGEDLARKYLISQGYEILAENWRFKRLEIDLIALQDNTVCFVEVKTRKNRLFGDPEDALTIQKQKNILLAAQEYIDAYKLDTNIRFDLITVVPASSSTPEVTHYPAVFQPFLF